MSKRTKLDAFAEHGLFVSDPSDLDSWQQTDCFACGKEGHLHLKGSTGQYNCKVCHTTGNLFSFLSYLSKQVPTKYTAYYAELCSLKEPLTAATFRRHHIFKNPLTGNWTFPILNKTGAINNAYFLSPPQRPGGNFIFRGTSTCAGSVIGLHEYKEGSTQPVWICEGHWDYLAIDQALRAIHQRQNIQLLGTSGPFPTAQLPLLNDCEVVHLGDCDAGGREQQASLINRLVTRIEKPKSFHILDWPTDEIPDGYDIRDCYYDFTIESEQPEQDLHNYITTNLKQPEEYNADPNSTTVKVDPLECRSFTDLVKRFGENLEISTDWERSLAVAMAVVFSIRMSDDFLWMHLVGPASCGKSTICDAMMAIPTTFSIFKMTGILSGWRSASGKDSSLVNSFDGKTVVTKDLTGLLMQPAVVTGNVFGDLREMYDGETSSNYRNEVANTYSGFRFNILTGVTGMIRGKLMADLGERFLMCNVAAPDSNFDSQAIATGRRMLTHFSRDLSPNGSDEEEPITHKAELYRLRQYCLGFWQHLQSHFFMPTVSDKSLDTIGQLAKLVACSRAKVNRGAGNELLYHPEIEGHGRVTGQLTKLAVALANVYGTHAVGPKVMGTVRKVALDSAQSFRLDIGQALYRQSMTIESLNARIRPSISTIRRQLDDMSELGLVENYVHSNGSKAGRPTNRWQLSEEFKSILNASNSIR